MVISLVAVYMMDVMSIWYLSVCNEIHEPMNIALDSVEVRFQITCRINPDSVYTLYLVT